jgi:hypothetical protein
MRLLRHRQQSQATALAAASIISIVAMMAFAIDAATFFVIRRELQNAADAAALAGAMYISSDTSVTPPPQPAGSQPNCSYILDDDPAVPDFMSPPYPSGLRNGPSYPDAVRAACYWANYNLYNGQASRLCNSKAHFKNAYTRADQHGQPYPELVVEVTCDAQYSFGRILNLRDREVSAYAIGALGVWVDSTSDFSSWVRCNPPPPAVPIPGCRDATRLIPD